MLLTEMISLHDIIRENISKPKITFTIVYCAAYWIFTSDSFTLTNSLAHSNFTISFPRPFILLCLQALWEANCSGVMFQPQALWYIFVVQLWLTCQSARLCYVSGLPVQDPQDPAAVIGWIPALDVSAGLLSLRLSITPVSQLCLTWQNLTWHRCFDIIFVTGCYLGTQTDYSLDRIVLILVGINGVHNKNKHWGSQILFLYKNI